MPEDAAKLSIDSMSEYIDLFCKNAVYVQKLGTSVLAHEYSIAENSQSLLHVDANEAVGRLIDACQNAASDPYVDELQVKA